MNPASLQLYGSPVVERDDCVTDAFQHIIVLKTS